MEKLSNCTTIVLTLAAWPFIRLIFCNAKILQSLLTEEFHSCLMRQSVHLCVHRKRSLEKVLEKLLSMVTSKVICQAASGSGCSVLYCRFLTAARCAASTRWAKMQVLSTIPRAFGSEQRFNSNFCVQCLAFFLKRDSEGGRTAEFRQGLRPRLFRGPLLRLCPPSLAAALPRCGSSGGSQRCQTVSASGQGPKPRPRFSPRTAGGPGSRERAPAATGGQQVSSLRVSEGRSPLSRPSCSKFPVAFPDYRSALACTVVQLCCLSFSHSAPCFLPVPEAWRVTAETQHVSHTASELLMRAGAEQSFLTSLGCWSNVFLAISPLASSVLMYLI